MDRSLFSKLIACLLFVVPCVCFLSAEENFLLINGITNERVLELGPHIDERITPCSTFKIVLSLMGYDAKILKDEKTPIWNFQEGYDDYLESWKAPQTPQSWMKYSCGWYSKILASQLGVEKIQNYLASLEYGNQDMSGGLTKPGSTNPTWVNGSIKISPKEQVDFIQKMISEKLPISPNAIEKTKLLLFKEELPEEWKLFGKTGWSGSISGSDGENFEIGWFVGWVEKDRIFFPFAYYIREKKINLTQRIPRVKELLVKSSCMNLKKKYVSPVGSRTDH